MTPLGHFLYYEINFGSPGAFAIPAYDKPLDHITSSRSFVIMKDGVPTHSVEVTGAR